MMANGAGILRSWVLSLAVFVTAVFMTSAIADAARFAAVTVDARTGDILFSSDMDGQRHPASLTKMMTLYLLFQDLKAGRVRLETPLTVSRRAAGMAPSKLGFKPGQTISVESAIRALVIKSANDVAAAIGENLEGTEGAFAARMTRVARSIGMSRTTYRNASGLPNPGQITTARDQATLGLRLMRDFPQYYPYFRTTSFTFRGRTIRTHNRLVGRFQGTDGIKTGYINASGYNLVTSTKRDQKRLVGVVMGGRSAGARNAYMVSMLSKQFANAKSGTTIAAVAGSSKGAVDPIALAASQKQVAKPSGYSQDSAKLAEVAESVSAADRDVDQPAVLEAQLESGDEAEEGENEMTTGSTGGSWSIGVGQFSNKKQAQSDMSKLRKLKSVDLSSYPAATEAVKFGKSVVYRSRFDDFNEQSAKSACQILAARKYSCVVLTPAS
jgi:D-alanyl-D-alanine carboxypeptidase